MKVILKKEAEYDFNEGKYTAIPLEVFTTLVGKGDIPSGEEALPKVIVFESKDDYLKNVHNYRINPNKSIYVSMKGQIFCFLDELSEDITNDIDDGDEPTDTEKSEGEQPGDRVKDI